MRKQALLDWGRRALIALLLVSAVLLLRRTGYYDGIRSRFGGSIGAMAERNTGAQAALPHPTGVMLPLAVTVRPAESGGRWGAAYDAEQTAAAFQRFSVDLSEALGSAGAPDALTEEDFRACLNRCCVVMHFSEPLYLELLSGWLGIEMNAETARQEVRILCLSASETEAALCCRTAAGELFRCATAVHAEAFRSRAAEFTPNGTIYGWESDRISAGDDTVLLDELPEIAAVKSAVPALRDGDPDAILTALGMNSFVTSSYSEADGTVVYVSDETTMRVSPNGTVFFRRAGSPEAGEPAALTEAVSRAYQTAEQCLGPFLGDGALHFAGVTDNAAQRSQTVLLDYTVNGIPVRLASGHAAEIVLRGETVIQARLQLRQFTLTEGRTELLPCVQAAAIAALRQGRPELVYADAGDATECMWVITDG